MIIIEAPESKTVRRDSVDIASTHGHIDVVKQLLEKGAIINHHRKVYGTDGVLSVEQLKCVAVCTAMILCCSCMYQVLC